MFSTKSLMDKEIDAYLSKHRYGDELLDFCYSVLREYAQGGKRLRPHATILSFRSAEGNPQSKILPIAIAVELHHVYSMILDDIMDEDEMRHHKPTVYKAMQEHFMDKIEGASSKLYSTPSARFAVSFGIMIGNITNILSRQAITSSAFSDAKKCAALRLLERRDQQIYHGQMKDMHFEYTWAREEDYLSMVENKTGALFGEAMQLGALFAGGDEHLQQEFFELGKTSAVAFQIHDDLLDLTEKKGHAPGSDIEKGKRTLLMLYLQQKSPDILQSKDTRKIIKAMHETGAVDHARKVARRYTQRAMRIVEKLPVQHKTELEELITFMVERER